MSLVLGHGGAGYISCLKAQFESWHHPALLASAAPLSSCSEASSGAARAADAAGDAGLGAASQPPMQWRQQRKCRTSSRDP